MTVPTGNEVQVVTLSASSGSFKLTFDGSQTGALAFDAAAATVQTALRALASVGGANVNVAGSAGGPFTVTFVGTLRDTNVPAMIPDNTALVGGVAVVTTPVAGNPPVTERAYVDISDVGGKVANLEILIGQTPPPGALLVDADNV